MYHAFALLFVLSYLYLHYWKSLFCSTQYCHVRPVLLWLSSLLLDYAEMWFGNSGPEDKSGWPNTVDNGSCGFLDLNQQYNCCNICFCWWKGTFSFIIELLQMIQSPILHLWTKNKPKAEYCKEKVYLIKKSPSLFPFDDHSRYKNF
ncbi:hypothetical protein ACH5RR_023857 [Cinchona calisaya]|uniref:Uncharacterized protein n=1 Tax=Cinchona calisaya TaxID=153742 RepID=A0ABD2ZF69_9GENT